MNESWDPDSEREYNAWIKSPNCSRAELKACAKLWAIMLEDLLVNGPVGLTQSVQVTRDDGVVVDLYCIVMSPNITMYFAYRYPDLHLVYLGPSDSPKTDDIALKRTKRW